MRSCIGLWILIHHLLIEKLAFRFVYLAPALKYINQCIIMQIKIMKLSVKRAIYLSRVQANPICVFDRWAFSLLGIGLVSTAIKSRLFAQREGPSRSIKSFNSDDLHKAALFFINTQSLIEILITVMQCFLFLLISA